MKKSILMLLIFIFLFLIFETSKNMWVETKLNVIRSKLKEKPFRGDPATENLLLNLQKFSPKNAKVWSLTARYYFKKMALVLTPQERLLWIEKAVYSSRKSLECNPFDKSQRAFLYNILRWRETLARVLAG